MVSGVATRLRWGRCCRGCEHPAEREVAAVAVTKRVRFEVLRRDGHTCRYCGASAPEVKLTVDHVVPQALGGRDDPANLVSACVDCNSGKSSTAPDSRIVDDVAEQALRWSWAMEQAAEIRRAQLAEQQEIVEEFDDAWCAYVVSTGHGGAPPGSGELPREPGWRDSVLRFVAAGLDAEFLHYAVKVAMTKSDVAHTDRWRYFCGVCWRELDRRRELAMQLLAASGAGQQPGIGATGGQHTGPSGSTTLGREVDQLLARGWPVHTLAACVQEWVARDALPQDFAEIADLVVNYDVAGLWFGGEIVPSPRTPMPEPQAFGDAVAELFQAWADPEPAV